MHMMAGSVLGAFESNEDLFRLVCIILSSVIYFISYSAIFYQIYREKSSKSHTLAAPITALLAMICFALSLMGLPDTEFQFASLAGGAVLNMVWIGFIIYYRERK